MYFLMNIYKKIYMILSPLFTPFSPDISINQTDLFYIKVQI